MSKAYNEFRKLTKEEKEERVRTSQFDNWFVDSFVCGGENSVNIYDAAQIRLAGISLSRFLILRDKFAKRLGILNEKRKSLRITYIGDKMWLYAEYPDYMIYHDTKHGKFYDLRTAGSDMRDLQVTLYDYAYSDSYVEDILPYELFLKLMPDPDLAPELYYTKGDMDYDFNNPGRNVTYVEPEKYPEIDFSEPSVEEDVNRFLDEREDPDFDPDKYNE